MLQEGDLAPEDIELEDQNGDLIKLADFKGQRLVVYFYPKDDTPGYTTEAKNFRDNVQTYDDAGIKIIGISADSVASHKKFATKYDLPFTLLSDPEKIAIQIFGAWENNKIKRRTWLINADWQIEKVYEDVSPAGHDGELCAFYGLQKP